VKRAFLLLLASIIWSQGTGATPPGSRQDVVGFFFDEEAALPCQDAPIGSQISAHLLLVHSSAPGGVLGWEGRVHISDSHVVVLAAMVRGLAIDVDTYPDYRIGLATPVLWAEAVSLMELRLLVVAQECVWIKLGPLPHHPSLSDEMVYVDGGNDRKLIVMRLATGVAGDPVGGINCDCPSMLAEQGRTWGGLKALYLSPLRR